MTSDYWTEVAFVGPPTYTQAGRLPRQRKIPAASATPVTESMQVLGVLRIRDHLAPYTPTLGSQSPQCSSICAIPYAAAPSQLRQHLRIRTSRKHVQGPHVRRVGDSLERVTNVPPFSSLRSSYPLDIETRFRLLFVCCAIFLTRSLV